jgi:hypothetical protein
LQGFFKASTLEKKAKALSNYATKHLNMTADAKVSDNLYYCPNYLTSPLAKRYSECSDKEDVQQLAQNCMLHECNRHCLKSTKAGTPRTCRSHYRTKSAFSKLNTPGMDLIEKAQIQIDRKNITF